MTVERVEWWNDGQLVAVEEWPAAPEPPQPPADDLAAQVADLRAALTAVAPPTVHVDGVTQVNQPIVVELAALRARVDALTETLVDAALIDDSRVKAAADERRVELEVVAKAAAAARTTSDEMMTVRDTAPEKWEAVLAELGLGGRPTSPSTVDPVVAPRL